jgi:hypothetical protein
MFAPIVATSSQQSGKYLNMKNYPMQLPAVAVPLSITPKSLADLRILHS